MLGSQEMGLCGKYIWHFGSAKCKVSLLYDQILNNNGSHECSKHGGGWAAGSWMSIALYKTAANLNDSFVHLNNCKSQLVTQIRFLLHCQSVQWMESCS